MFHSLSSQRARVAERGEESRHAQALTLPLNCLHTLKVSLGFRKSGYKTFQHRSNVTSENGPEW